MPAPLRATQAMKQLFYGQPFISQIAMMVMLAIVAQGCGIDPSNGGRIIRGLFTEEANVCGPNPQTIIAQSDVRVGDRITVQGIGLTDQFEVTLDGEPVMVIASSTIDQIEFEIPSFEMSCFANSGCPYDLVISNSAEQCTLDLPAALTYMIQDGDGDNLSDDYEVLSCDSEPNASDSDNDNLGDFEECLLSLSNGVRTCSARNPDSDGDGINDFEEWTIGGQSHCQLSDLDGDGDNDITDCAPTDNQRGHGLPDPVADGVDRNCVIERQSCSGNGIDLFYDNGSQGYQELQIISAIMPGTTNPNDQWQGATLYYATYRNGWRLSSAPNFVLGYEVPAHQNLSCGASILSGPLQSPTVLFSFVAHQTTSVCAVNGLSTGANYARYLATGAEGLRITLDTNFDWFQSGNFSPANPALAGISGPCEFGD